MRFGPSALRCWGAMVYSHECILQMFLVEHQVTILVKTVGPFAGGYSGQQTDHNVGQNLGRNVGEEMQENKSMSLGVDHDSKVAIATWLKQAMKMKEKRTKLVLGGMLCKCVC